MTNACCMEPISVFADDTTLAALTVFLLCKTIKVVIMLFKLINLAKGYIVKYIKMSDSVLSHVYLEIENVRFGFRDTRDSMNFGICKQEF